MKFRNRLDVSLKFSMHGRTHDVAPHGEWECPARLAFAVKRSQLPLEPVGEIADALVSEAPVAGNTFEDLVTFKSESDDALRFTFHNMVHNVAPRGVWECPARMASAVVKMKLPMKRLGAPKELSSEPTSGPRPGPGFSPDAPVVPFPNEPEFSRPQRKMPPKPSNPLVDTSGATEK